MKEMIKYTIIWAVVLWSGTTAFALNREESEYVKIEAISLVLQFLKSTPTYSETCKNTVDYKGDNIDSMVKAYDCVTNSKTIIVEPILKQALDDNHIDSFFAFVAELPLKNPARKQLPEYQQLLIGLDNLKNIVVSEQNTASGVQTASLEPQPVKVIEEPIESTRESNKSTGFLLYGLTGLAIALSLFSLMKASLSKKQQNPDVENLKGELKSLKEEVARQKNEISKKSVGEEAVRELMLNVQSLDKKLNEALVKITTPQRVQEQTKIADRKTEIKQAEPVVEKTINYIQYYARFADDDGYFSSSFLKKNPDGQSVFILRVREDGTGEFTITTDVAIQQNVALSNFDRLFSKTCSFSSYPQAGASKIITKTPGKVKLNGDRWQIQSKAIIEIV